MTTSGSLLGLCFFLFLGGWCAVQVGGSNAWLTDTSIPRMLALASQEATIIFGADVTHPMANDERPSIAAVRPRFSLVHKKRTDGFTNEKRWRKEQQCKRLAEALQGGGSPSVLRRCPSVCA